MTESEKWETFECIFPESDETRGSEVTELPIVKYPAPDRGERRVYYMPAGPNDNPATGTEFEARDGYRERMNGDKSDQDQ